MTQNNSDQVGLTNEELEAIEARHRASTQGEWEDYVTDDGALVVHLPSTAHIFIADMEDADKQDLGDATFIANAHQDIPNLLATIRAQAVRIEVLEATAKQPSHYDSPDNKAWLRANYGLPPEPGDPGYEDYAGTLKHEAYGQVVDAAVAYLNTYFRNFAVPAEEVMEDVWKRDCAKARSVLRLAVIAVEVLDSTEQEDQGKGAE